ncbi:MAG: ABC transporter substrate-binding protein [Candidatus Heimdallarchaeota archaeon]|nr:ABC transporter substrate-binding protein [Candidatus Heimdallarchaeota archaeon]
MNTKRKTISLGLLFLLVGVLSLSTAQANPVGVNAPTGDPTTTYMIGVLAPISGELAPLGQGLLDGIRAAAWEINRSADFSFNVTWYIQDSKAEETAAVAAYNVVKAAGVELIIGAAGSSASKAVAELARVDHIPQISYASTAEMLSNPLYDYFWRTVPKDSLQAAGLAELMNATGYHDIVIVHRGDDYGTGFGDSLKTEFRGMGNNVSSQISYFPGTTDFSVTVSSIKAAINAEAIAMISYVVDGGSFITEVRNAGIDLPIFGTDGIADASLLDPSQTTATIVEDSNFTLGTRPHSFGTGEGKFDDFNASLQALEAAGLAYFGGEISLFSDFAYDAMMVGCLAIEAAGSYDGASINAEIAAVGKSYIGATGNKTFSSLGDVTQSSYDVWQFQDGTVHAVGNWTSADGVMLFNNFVDPETYESGFTTTATVPPTGTTIFVTVTSIITSVVRTPGFTALFGLSGVAILLYYRKRTKK